MDLDHSKYAGQVRDHSPYGVARSRRSQAILVIYIIAWPVATLAAPAAWIYHPVAGLLFALLIGLHINTQLGFFYHELWHKAFFRAPRHNHLFFWIISFYHLSGPQIYGIAHATHHRDVHTFDDLEFWPRKDNTSVTRARIALIFELFFGIIAWSLRVTPVITKHPRYSRRSGLIFVGGWIVMFAGLMLSARLIYGDLYWYAAVAYWLHLLLFAVALRMLQFLEHLGITAPELDYQTRTRLTRNAKCSGFLNRLWHKLTLNETAEHTLHHVRAGIPYRKYAPRSPQPPSTPVRTVSVTDLPRIIWNYWKDPLRTIGPDSPDLDEIPDPK